MQRKKFWRHSYLVMLQPFLTEIKFLLQNLSQTSKSKFKRYVQLTLLITIVNYHSPPSFPVGCTPAHPPTQWNAPFLTLLHNGMHISLPFLSSGMHISPPSNLVGCTPPHPPALWYQYRPAEPLKDNAEALLNAVMICNIIILPLLWQHCCLCHGAGVLIIK